MDDLTAFYLTHVRPYFDQSPDDALLNQYEPIAAGELRQKMLVGAEGTEDNPICRFCGRGPDATTFELVPHAVPEFLGNTKLIATDECDNCNNKFGGTIESDLANYLGIERILTGIKGKNGLPKEKFKGGSIQKGKHTKLVEVCSIPGGKSVSLDRDQKTITFKTTRAPYVPAGIFKCLTKIAISIMPDEYLEEFSDSRKWVEKAHDDWDFLPPSALRVIKSTIYLPNPYPYVHILLARRKANIFNCPYMLFQISFSNIVLQIPVFRGKADIPVFGERSLKLSIPVIPNRYGLNPATRPLVEVEILDLSNTDKLRNDEQIVTMSYDSMINLDVSNLTLDKGQIKVIAEIHQPTKNP
ncbi:hypothetical protein [Pseudomonas syringae]|uniref:hypothetical protein n=1 Tax=Pseudomonas syringae TaxID=317 RepID=UPI000209205F|nr:MULTISPECIES: hypothetical protein [Pseudomonas syringae group]EGH94861.1 hypothetical protein PLA106_02790 [Pseudomonas amygdali pv. lachrymans str. M302278]KPC11548.1 Uncharacterized protein AC500_1200 [Pseudomonas amygdali pv. lachrymans]RMM10873.1 hypothetical protein ALQ85_200086 [Pseudomonas syringae]VVM38268.1 hypothetical protein PS634_00138 [Pseudomonas fluorescens]